MNTTFTKESLVEWIEAIKEAAENDNAFSIAWFEGTKDQPFSIIAGWEECFSAASGVSDTFCVSTSEPKYVMCIKIAENEGPYAYTDFELMNMPYDRDSGDVDDTDIMLEWDDDAEELADFFTHEWERIMETYNEEI